MESVNGLYAVALSDPYLSVLQSHKNTLFRQHHFIFVARFFNQKKKSSDDVFFLIVKM